MESCKITNALMETVFIMQNLSCPSEDDYVAVEHGGCKTITVRPENPPFFGVVTGKHRMSHQLLLRYFSHPFKDGDEMKVMRASGNTVEIVTKSGIDVLTGCAQLNSVPLEKDSFFRVTAYLYYKSSYNRLNDV